MFLDTHVAIWIGEKKLGKLSKKAVSAIEGSALIYLPAMARLELQVLSEIGKIKITPHEVIASLRNHLDLQISGVLFYDICDVAQSLSWTRDPFGRLIVAEAICAGNAPLVTADANIHEYYKKAIW